MHFESSILKKDIIQFLVDIRQTFKGWLRECGIGRVVDISARQTLSEIIAEVCKA